MRARSVFSKQVLRENFWWSLILILSSLVVCLMNLRMHELLESWSLFLQTQATARFCLGLPMLCCKLFPGVSWVNQSTLHFGSAVWLFGKNFYDFTCCPLSKSCCFLYFACFISQMYKSDPYYSIITGSRSCSLSTFYSQSLNNIHILFL